MNNKQFTPIYDTDYIQKWYLDEKIQGNGGVILEHVNNSDGSSYIKFSDGTLICYKIVAKLCNINSSWGSLYRGIIDLGDWPVEFKDRPQVQVSNVNTYNSMLAGFSVRPSKTKAGTLMIVRPDSISVTTYINVMGIGKWK